MEGPEIADESTGTLRIQAVDRAVVLLKAVANSTTPPTVLELAQAYWHQPEHGLAAAANS